MSSGRRLAMGDPVLALMAAAALLVWLLRPTPAEAAPVSGSLPMRSVHRAPIIDPVDTAKAIRLVLEAELDGGSIAGVLQPEVGPPVPFSGWPAPCVAFL